jgi:hypothetical protein
MKGYLTTITLAFFTLSLSSCFFGKNKGKGVPDDGQLHGVAPLAKQSMLTPRTMVYVPPGTFHMGPSDEDVSFNYSNRNRNVSIPGFWMDATEITNLLDLLEAQSDDIALDPVVPASLKTKIQSLNIKANLKNDLLKRVDNLQKKQAIVKTLSNLSKNKINAKPIVN